jgi:hypothetical protein
MVQAMGQSCYTRYFEEKWFREKELASPQVEVSALEVPKMLGDLQPGTSHYIGLAWTECDPTSSSFQPNSP